MFGCAYDYLKSTVHTRERVARCQKRTDEIENDYSFYAFGFDEGARTTGTAGEKNRTAFARSFVGRTRIVACVAFTTLSSRRRRTFRTRATAEETYQSNTCIMPLGVLRLDN